MRSLLRVAALLVFAAGLSATLFWWLYGGRPAFAAAATPGLALVLACVVLLSSANLGLRWLRWHFLTRRYIRSVPARTSAALYFGTLPAFATPLYLGELVRTALVARRVPGARRAVFTVWVVERLADAGALVLFLLVVRASWGIPIVFAVALAGLALARSRMKSHALGLLLQPRVLAFVGVTSALAWLLPVAGLWGIVHQLGHPISIAAAAEVFSLGTLAGAVALLPLGAGVTGSSMIVQLDWMGVSAEASIVSIALLRLGTTWYALALGVLAFFRWRRTIVSVARERPAHEHFDQLADAYADQIPAGVRDRVVGRKVEVMSRWLGEAHVERGARGLDVGCGQGWYTAELARRGYAMNACDRSPAQVRQAHRFTTGRGERSGSQPPMRARCRIRTAPSTSPTA